MELFLLLGIFQGLTCIKPSIPSTILKCIGNPLLMKPSFTDEETEAYTLSNLPTVTLRASGIDRMDSPCTCQTDPAQNYQL